MRIAWRIAVVLWVVIVVAVLWRVTGSEPSEVLAIATSTPSAGPRSMVDFGTREAELPEGGSATSPLTDRASNPAAKKETTFTRYIAATRFGETLAKICQQHCKVAPGAQPDDVPNGTRWRPAFCTAVPPPVYSFSRDPSIAQPQVTDPDRTVVVFSALGERYYGPGGQEYVWEAVRQWRLFHPATESDVRVIVDDAVATDPNVVGNASSYDVTLERKRAIMPSVPEWRRFDRVFYIQGYMHPGGSRETGNKKFNQLVMARFFGLQGLMRRDGLHNVIHLENDMMVYRDFRGVVGAWARCGAPLATIFPAAKGAIPGVLLVRDADAIGRFTSYATDLLSCGGVKFGKLVQPGYANDMTYFRNFFQLYGSAAIADLPNQLHAAGENCIADELGRTLFDGASFGQWYSFAISAKGPPEAEGVPSPREIAPYAPDHGAAASKGGATTRSVDDAAMSRYVEATARAQAKVAVSRPPQHIQNAMRERYLDATPGEYLHWQLDSTGGGRRIPVYRGYRVAVMHVHAKNLFWFRSA
jgi:hypothetical protein